MFLPRYLCWVVLCTIITQQSRHTLVYSHDLPYFTVFIQQMLERCHKNKEKITKIDLTIRTNNQNVRVVAVVIVVVVIVVAVVVVAVVVVAHVVVDVIVVFDPRNLPLKLSLNR